MKVTLNFNMDDPDDRSKHDKAINGFKAFMALIEIKDQVFRPSWNHGYDKKIEDLLEKCGESVDKDGDLTNNGSQIIGLLADIYFEIIQDNNLNLDE